MTDSDKEGIFHDDEARHSSEAQKGNKKPPRLEPQDYELLAILHKNEEQYFVEVDTRFRTQLYRYLGRKATVTQGFTKEDIEELVQVTLERFYIWACNKHKISKPIEVNHKAYLLTIAKNVYLDEIKDRKKHSTLSLDNPISSQEENTTTTLAELLPDPHDEDEQERKIFLDKVRDTIEQLREPYRTVMRHFAVDGMSEKEIIDYLKVKPNTGKAWVRRGRNMLKETLPEYKDYL